MLPQEWITDNKYNFTIQYSREQENYIVTEGYFKGGVIEGYEQDGRAITSSFSKDGLLSGFTLYHKQNHIRFSITKEALSDKEYSDGVSDGESTGESTGESSGDDGEES